MFTLSRGSRWAIGSVAILFGCALLLVSIVNNKPTMAIGLGLVGFLIALVCFFPRALSLTTRSMALVGSVVCMGVIYQALWAPVEVSAIDPSGTDDGGNCSAEPILAAGVDCNLAMKLTELGVAINKY